MIMKRLNHGTNQSCSNAQMRNANLAFCRSDSESIAVFASVGQTDRHTHTHTDTHTHTQTGRQADTDRYRHTDTDTDIQIQTGRQQTERQTDYSYSLYNDM